MSKVNKKIILTITLVLLIMLILPYIILTFLESYVALGCILILFFGINPIVAIMLGILAGTEIRELWCIPLAIAVVFPMLYWIVIQGIVWDLYVYSVGYLVLGSISMIITALVLKKLRGCNKKDK